MNRSNLIYHNGTPLHRNGIVMVDLFEKMGGGRKNLKNSLDLPTDNALMRRVILDSITDNVSSAQSAVLGLLKVSIFWKRGNGKIYQGNPGKFSDKFD